MDYNRTNSERSNARQSEDAASDDNVIVINMDDYDFTDNDHQDDISQQPKEENGDPDTSNINTNQELNMEADDSSVNEELKPSFTTSYKNEIDTSVIHDSVSGAANRIPCEQERILEEDSQSHGKSSNNDMVVKLDLNGIDLGENEENSSSNIKRDEGECKIMAKMTTNENLPLQHALTSNTSAMPMPPSPHTPNIDITSNLELLNIGQTQNEEVKNVLEPEVSFPKEDENLEDSDSSDDEMKINLLYDKEKNEYMIKEEFCSSDKSESAISLNIKRSKDRLPVQNACQAESTEIVYEDSASAENQDDLIKIPIPSEEPTPQKEESGNKISIPLKENEVSNFEMENDKEDSASEENKILLNLGGDDSSAQNNENQILVHETDSPCKIKLTGNFPEMNFDDIDVTKYLPKSPEKSYPDEASSSHLENPNLIQINFDAENEDDYVIKIPNIEDSPDKQVQNSDMEDKFQIPVSPLPQSSDDGKISIPLIPPHTDKDQQESSIFRIPADFSTKTEEPWQGRKRDEKAKYKETTRPRSDTFGEESKIQQVVIQNSIRNYYKLDMQKVNLKVVLPREPEESPVLQGQTIFMFNRKVEEDMNKDAIRKLSFNFHSKFLKITKISTAKRFRKRNENQKVVSTYHQRKGDLEYDFDEEGFQQFASNCSRSINAQDSEYSSPNTSAFEKKP